MHEPVQQGLAEFHPKKMIAILVGYVNNLGA